MTFYNHIESVRAMAIDLTNGGKWHGTSDKAAVFDALDAARREYMRLSDENVRLRELIADVLAYGRDGGFLCADGAWSCPHYQECFNCPVEDGPEKYVRRGCGWLALARELGVEVDE